MNHRDTEGTEKTPRPQGEDLRQWFAQLKKRRRYRIVGVWVVVVGFLSAGFCFARELQPGLVVASIISCVGHVVIALGEARRRLPIMCSGLTLLAGICLVMGLRAEVRGAWPEKQIIDAGLMCGLMPLLFLLTFLEIATALSTERSDAVCRKCGYSLMGLVEPRCPECGLPFDPSFLRYLRP